MPDAPTTIPPLSRREYELALAVTALEQVSPVIATKIDPTGAVDALPVLQAAVDALSITGGTLYLPAGSYKLSGTLQLGNGSASGVNTLKAIRIVGACPPPWLGTGAGQGQSVPGPVGTTRLFTTGSTDLIHINGPCLGYGLENLVLDGASHAPVGLQVTAAVGCTFRNLAVWDCVVTGISTASLNPTGALAGLTTNCMHNRFEYINIRVPTNAWAKGIYITGDGASTLTNTCYDEWVNLSLYAMDPGGGVTTYGFYIVACDNVTFRHVHCMSNTANTVLITFDYSAPAWGGIVPCDVRFIDVDLGTGQVSNNGVCNATVKNRISSLAGTNGTPANPLLKNLEWEGVRAKAGAPVAADIPAGQSAVFRDTTNNTTKLYYNNAGVLMSVALA